MDKGCGIMRRLFTSASKHAFLDHRTTRACHFRWALHEVQAERDDTCRGGKTSEKCSQMPGIDTIEPCLRSVGGQIVELACEQSMLRRWSISSGNVRRGSRTWCFFGGFTRLGGRTLPTRRTSCMCRMHRTHCLRYGHLAQQCRFRKLR